MKRAEARFVQAACFMPLPCNLMDGLIETRHNGEHGEGCSIGSCGSSSQHGPAEGTSGFHLPAATTEASAYCMQLQAPAKAQSLLSGLLPIQLASELYILLLGSPPLFHYFHPFMASCLEVFCYHMQAVAELQVVAVYLFYFFSFLLPEVLVSFVVPAFSLSFLCGLGW